MNEKKPYMPSTELASGETVAKSESVEQFPITHESIPKSEEEIRLAIDAALDMPATEHSLDSLLKNMEKATVISLEEARNFMSRFEENIIPQLQEDKSLFEGLKNRNRLKRFVAEVDRRRKIVTVEQARIKAEEERVQQAHQKVSEVYQKSDRPAVFSSSVVPEKKTESIPKEKGGFFSRMAKFFTHI